MHKAPKTETVGRTARLTGFEDKKDAHRGPPHLVRGTLMVAGIRALGQRWGCSFLPVAAPRSRQARNDQDVVPVPEHYKPVMQKILRANFVLKTPPYRDKCWSG